MSTEGETGSRSDGAIKTKIYGITMIRILPTAMNISSWLFAKAIVKFHKIFYLKISCL